MKIKIPQRAYWNVNIASDFYYKIRYNKDSFEVQNTDKIDDVVESILTFWHKFVCRPITAFINFFKRDTIIIEEHDLWNADITLAKIILPVLYRVKENPYSYATVENVDVPEELTLNEHSETYDCSDDLGAARWNYILDQMIYAFDKISDNDELDVYFTGDSFNREAYEQHEVKVKNGLRLFGKYYRALWI